MVQKTLAAMSQSLVQFCRRTVSFIELPGVRYRWKRSSKGKDFQTALSLSKKLELWKNYDPRLDYKVNIGEMLVAADRSKVMKDKLEHQKKIKADLNLFRAVKNGTFQANLENIEKMAEASTTPMLTFEAAKYYGIFDDLFENGYFVPVLPLRVTYECNADETYAVPVFRGNIVKPYEASEKPVISYNAPADKYFTLVMTTPDGHLTENSKEYLMWMVGNIPGNSVSEGEELCSYLPPFPYRGLGYCRYVFVLYKHDKKIDLSNLKLENPCLNLTARTFSTYDFYRDRQSDLTPVGLRFFQAEWDQTLTSFFQNVLDMPEPTFEYEFEDTPLPPQKWFPHREPFNLYLDMYKHPKQLQKELLLEKLKERHPFKPPPKPLKYPLAHEVDKTLPTWLKDDIARRRVKEGKWKFM